MTRTPPQPRDVVAARKAAGLTQKQADELIYSTMTGRCALIRADCPTNGITHARNACFNRTVSTTQTPRLGIRGQEQKMKAIEVKIIRTDNSVEIINSEYDDAENKYFSDFAVPYCSALRAADQSVALVEITVEGFAAPYMWEGHATAEQIKAAHRYQGA